MGPIFRQNTLPLMVTILVAVGAAIVAGWISNTNLSKRIDHISSNLSRRIDDTNRRLDEVISRLERIETKLETHGNRLTALEERTSPLRR